MMVVVENRQKMGEIKSNYPFSRNPFFLLPV